MSERFKPKHEQVSLTSSEKVTFEEIAHQLNSDMRRASPGWLKRTFRHQTAAPSDGGQLNPDAELHWTREKFAQYCQQVDNPAVPKEITESPITKKRSRRRKLALQASGVVVASTIAGVLGYLGSGTWDSYRAGKVAQADYDRLNGVASDEKTLRNLGICSIELAAQADWNAFTYGKKISPREQAQKNLLDTALSTANEAQLPCTVSTGAEYVIVDGKAINRSDFTVFSKQSWCENDRYLQRKVPDPATAKMNEIRNYFFTPTCDTAAPPQSYSPYTRPQVTQP